MQSLGGEQMGQMLALVAQFRAQGKRIIPMHAGEPDFATPENITDAAVTALRAGQTHYTPAAGILALRQVIAQTAGDVRHIAIEPMQVIVVPGAKPMIHFTMMALCQEGDEVLCPDPGYPFYAALARLHGATPVSYALEQDTGFRIDVERLREHITTRTKLLVLNSPSNPTGMMLPLSDLEAIANLCLEHDLYVLSDEIYSRIVYDKPFASIASLPGMAERTLIIDGFSKTYAMTGWRLGYGILPRALAPYVTSLMLNTLSCNVAFLQPAAVEALCGPQEDVTRMVETFRHRRELVMDRLSRVPGVCCLKPEGAFYAFVRVEQAGMTSQELSEYLVTNAQVATYPGSAFGKNGEGFVRLSFACSDSDIEEGISRIQQTLQNL
jgi:aspartate/methionine/tyrosine aminotransferase